MREYVGPPLTRESLADLLDREGIRERAYSLFGARKDDAIVMDHRPEGWVVFYTERGHDADLRRHQDEAAACLDLLDRVWNVEMNRFVLVAGPAPRERADEEFAQWLGTRGLERTDLADADVITQDTPWVAGEPHHRRYWVRITRARSAS